MKGGVTYTTIAIDNRTMLCIVMPAILPWEGTDKALRLPLGSLLCQLSAVCLKFSVLTQEGIAQLLYTWLGNSIYCGRKNKRGGGGRPACMGTKYIICHLLSFFYTGAGIYNNQV